MRQSDEVSKILEHRVDAYAVARNDLLLFGWPGSGRSTLCNLVTLAAIFHREGAVHCVSAESPQRNANAMPGRELSATARP